MTWATSSHAQAARCDVGDQHPEAPPELAEGRVALRLRAIAVNQAVAEAVRARSCATLSYAWCG